jgi:hypothetical protein
MSKAVITRLFIGGLVAFVAGLVIAMFAALSASPFAWSMIAVVMLGGLAMVGGAVAGLVAWIGALINTAQLDDKLWFIVLLVLGLFSFGFVAMIAYVVAGPDSTKFEGRPVQAMT